MQAKAILTGYRLLDHLKKYNPVFGLQGDPGYEHFHIDVHDVADHHVSLHPLEDEPGPVAQASTRLQIPQEHHWDAGLYDQPVGRQAGGVEGAQVLGRVAPAVPLLVHNVGAQQLLLLPRPLGDHEVVHLVHTDVGGRKDPPPLDPGPLLRPRLPGCWLLLLQDFTPGISLICCLCFRLHMFHLHKF